MSDGAADGATGVMYGMSIRAKGETDRENLDRLLGRLPSLTHTSHSVESTFDRGYGKMPNIQANASKGYNFFTMQLHRKLKRTQGVGSPAACAVIPTINGLQQLYVQLAKSPYV